jgi:hypothetical protein
MPMLRFGVPLFLLFFQLTFGQASGEKIIHGKIVVVSGTIEGVNIVNIVNEKSTITDSNGDFFILAKAEDLLVFSSVNLEYHRKIIEEEDFKQDVLIIKMTSKTIELEEVIVKQPDINAVSLGISPKGIKKYTPAERRLKTAGDFKPLHLLSILGGSLAVDPILNAISGRTKMLKKELEVEKKERLLVIIDALYKEDYYSTVLKIPTDYIKGFQYYCIEEPNFAEVLNTKNKTKIEFLLIPLAVKYNQILSNEK